ncbi:MAG TPA: pyridoxal phosphate-dependent aminotransferase [Bacillota bacterium]|jgi:aspartate/methionine/tyrosine aminotransferase
MIEGLIAGRMENLGAETAFDVLAKAKALEAQGKRIIHMEIGEPDFDTPAHIRARAAQALEEGQTHYVPSPGIPALRETVAAYVSRTRGIDVAPEEVVVTPGGKPILFFAIMALINPGDEVLCPNPGFPIYESCIRFNGGVAVPLPLLEEKDFTLDVEDLKRKISPKTKLIIINSPSNPTGGVMSPQDIREIATAVAGRPIMVLSDEIYDRLVYEGEIKSISAEPGMKDQTIILDGFSKTYAMTGWRLGFGVMPKPLAALVGKLLNNSVSCTPPFIQLAGVTALTGPQDGPAAMRAEFRRRRDVIVKGLNEIPGVRCAMPKGAFYVFPNVSAFGLPGKQVADYLLNEGGVACLGGTAFGQHGEGYIRLSYATSLENIQEGLVKMREALAKLPMKGAAGATVAGV